MNNIFWLMYGIAVILLAIYNEIRKPNSGEFMNLLGICMIIGIGALQVITQIIATWG